MPTPCTAKRSANYQYFTTIDRWGQDFEFKGTVYRSQPPLYIREDTVDHRLLFRFISPLAGTTGSDTGEQLYFDYTIRQGDSFRFQYADVQVTATHLIPWDTTCRHPGFISTCWKRNPVDAATGDAS